MHQQALKRRVNRRLSLYHICEVVRGRIEVCRLSGSLEPGSMNSLEANTNAFVIRIWLEEMEEDGQVTWRGHITHVMSGKRHYLKDLESILAFIRPYLKITGGQAAEPPCDP